MGRITDFFCSGRRSAEIVKSALIAVLVCTAALLLAKVGYYDKLITRQSFESEVTAAADYGDDMTRESAIPAAVIISFGEGERYAAAWDDTAVTSAFSRFAALLGEALGSAEAGEDITESDWRAALEEQGAVFDYCYPRRLDFLAQWLGTDAESDAGEHEARRVALIASEGGVELYFTDTDGAFRRCSTAVSVQALTTALSAFEPNGAQFAYECGQDALAPYTLMLPSKSEAQAVAAENPMSGYSAARLFTALGMSGNAASPYTEPDGVSVYVDGEKTLRISPDGAVTYRCSSGGGSGATAYEAMTSAMELVYLTLGETSGDANVVLAGFEYDEEADEYTVRFDYVIDRCTVALADYDCAATVVVSSGVITRASLLLRSYSLTGESVELLPMERAAVAASVSGGGEMRLVYGDNGVSVTCGWAVA
ncbi:MAG: hypothetical protein LUE06_08660 [Oscillospiraceae bacterium]|nr:hypothetical protein [Oscillospiraceae bacterium]